MTNDIIIYQTEDGQTQIDVRMEQEVAIYNLDVIISVGYRVKNKRSTVI